MAKSGDELIKELYTELHRLARARIAKWQPGNTLQPTALVNEAYLRLMQNENSGWNGPGHFFGAAANAMRNILVDHARKKAALKHGGKMQQVDMTVTFPDGSMTASADELLALHEALERMQEAHPSKAQLVLLRYFAGLTMAQIADVMEIPKRTLERDWRFARAWLRNHLT